MIRLVACAGMAVLNNASSATGANTSQRNLLIQVQAIRLATVAIESLDILRVLLRSFL